MYCVYILFLKNHRFYVGQTRRWRLQTRWEEHIDPSFVAAKWTTKYPPICKGPTFECKTLPEARALEQKIVLLMLKQFGLDSVRGGKFNMTAEGPRTHWWVHRDLVGIPCFTSQFFAFSEHRFSAFPHCGHILSEDQPLFELTQRLKSLSIHEKDVHPALECSSFAS